MSLPLYWKFGRVFGRVLEVSDGLISVRLVKPIICSLSYSISEWWVFAHVSAPSGLFIMSYSLL